MKRTVLRLDRIQQEAREIRDQVLQLERESERISRQLDQVLQSVDAFYRNNGSHMNSYLRERVRRLQALLLTEEDRLGYRPSRFHPLFRQLDRILDSDAGDLFGNALDRRLNRMAGEMANHEKARTSVETGLHIFRLQDTLFGIQGTRLSEESLEPEKTGAQKEDSRRMILFPGTDSYLKITADQLQNYYIRTNTGTLYHLRMEELIRTEEGYRSDELNRKLLDLKRPHPYIAGKLRMKSGKFLYMFAPDPEGSGNEQ